MYKYIGIVIILLNGFVIFPTKAQFQNQNSDRMDQRVLYTKYIVQDFMDKDKTWFWMMDIVYRRQSDFGDDFNVAANPLRLSVRPYIGRMFGRFLAIQINPLGYFRSHGRLGNENDQLLPLEHELRTTLEILKYGYIHRRGKEWINYTHRYRFESRWRDVWNPEGDVVWNWRFRYRIRFRVPLNGRHFYENNVFYLVNYHELHIENGPEFGINNFAQNRNFIGVGYRFWDWVRVDVGYVHQYNWRNSFNPQTGNQWVDMSRGPMVYLFVDYLSKVRLPGKDKRLMPQIHLHD
ncbi:DUF2490 domain-containing protein [Cytophagaceae bacterium ABcell3]|nr:DUF2490 domain-containing protein [Cytophagaceae bacterium ABcell3]